MTETDKNFLCAIVLIVLIICFTIFCCFVYARADRPAALVSMSFPALVKIPGTFVSKPGISTTVRLREWTFIRGYWATPTTYVEEWHVSPEEKP